MRQVGLEPDAVFTPDIDETPLPRELPRAHALRLAGAKATLAFKQHPGAFILAADTVVGCGRRIMPKAETPAMVVECLRLLSGRRHRVHGGIALIQPSGVMRTRLSESVVAFRRMTEREIEAYAACGEGIGKAGGYAIQGRMAANVAFLSGSYSNVVGLSLFDVAQLLRGAGFDLASLDQAEGAACPAA